MTTKRNRLRILQERFHDPALTALTILLAFLVFVIGPLQAVGVLGAHHFAIVMALVTVAGIFIVSGNFLGESYDRFVARQLLTLIRYKVSCCEAMPTSSSLRIRTITSTPSERD